MTRFLSATFLVCLFASITVSAQTPNDTTNVDNPASQTTADDRPMDEVIVTAPGARKKLTVRSGWRPSSPAGAEEHMRNAYALLRDLDALAKDCDPESIVTFGSVMQRRKCENFLEEFDSRALSNYRIQCRGLTEWYRELVSEFQKDPEWATRDKQVVLWFSVTKQNLILTCDLPTVRKDFRYFDAAMENIGRIRQLVDNGRNPPSGIGGFAPLNNPLQEADDDS